MNSRYDFMNEGSVADEDGELYPDILSADYSKFKLTEVPEPIMVSAGFIQKPWTLMYNKLNVTYYDDLLLSMNGIPYVGMLEPGSQIWLFSLYDMENFKTNVRDEYK